MNLVGEEFWNRRSDKTGGPATGTSVNHYLALCTI
jgi:hypothetical protein